MCLKSLKKFNKISLYTSKHPEYIINKGFNVKSRDYFRFLPCVFRAGVGKGRCVDHGQGEPGEVIWGSPWFKRHYISIFFAINTHMDAIPVILYSDMLAAVLSPDWNAI